MKKNINFVCMFLLVCGLAVLSSCKDDETTPAAPAAPAALEATEVTDISAVLKWEGEAADYEVIVGEAESKVVAGKTYTATGLTAETDYTWKVRAKAGDLYSDWVDGPAFKTTEAAVVPDETVDLPYVEYFEYSSDYFDEAAGTDTSNFLIYFSTYDPDGDDYSGYKLSLDFCTTQVDEGGEYLDIPAGTYKFSSTIAPGNIVLGPEDDNYTIFTIIQANGDDVEPVITGGTLTVSGDHADYSISATFTLDDGRLIQCNYNGPIMMPPPIDPGDLGELGEFTNVYFMEFEADDLNNYFLILQDDNYVETGTGWELILDMYAPGESGLIPDGTYTVGGNDAWQIDSEYSSFCGYVTALPVVFSDVVSGTVETVMTAEDTYTIEIDVTTVDGDEIVRTYSGPVAIMQLEPMGSKAAKAAQPSGKFLKGRR